MSRDCIGSADDEFDPRYRRNRRTGGHVVEYLRKTGIRPRIFSRSGRPGTLGGDILSGEGLPEAVRGVATVIHCATSPLRRMRHIEVDGTSNLIRAASEAGVEHLVYVSIVGIDRAPTYPYYRAKLDAERLISEGPLPYSILRATQFFDLVLKAVSAIAGLPVAIVPNGFPGQPIDAAEVAERVVQIALSGPRGRAEDIGGPEVMTATEAVRTYLTVTGSHRRVCSFRVPGKTARAFRAGALICPEHRYGRRTWREFLEATLQARREV